MRKTGCFLSFLVVIFFGFSSMAMNYGAGDRQSTNVIDARHACANAKQMQEGAKKIQKQLKEESPVSSLPPVVTRGVIGIQRDAFAQRIDAWKKLRNKYENSMMKNCSYPGQVGENLVKTIKAMSDKIESYADMHRHYDNAYADWGN